MGHGVEFLAILAAILISGTEMTPEQGVAKAKRLVELAEQAEQQERTSNDQSS